VEIEEDKKCVCERERNIERVCEIEGEGDSEGGGYKMRRR
jgi:hypothetical protein